ncbi:MAG: thermonuclease family protein [Gemmatimonadota bacterium]|jgi:micrococcal nuclease
MPKSSGRKQERNQPPNWFLRRSTQRTLIVLVLAVVGLGVEYCRDDRGRGPGEAASTDRERYEDQVFRIDHVIDGDTAVLSDGTSVRLIGIDAPEMVPVQQCGAMEATQLHRELIDEKTVTVRLDPAETRDRYGRLLAYLERDNTIVNLELVRSGWVCAFPFGDTRRFRDDISAAEADARSVGRGVWGDCPLVPRGCPR